MTSVNFKTLSGGLALCAAVLLLTACDTPLLKVDYHKGTAPTQGDATIQAGGTAPLVAANGALVPQGSGAPVGQLWRAPDAAMTGVGGYVIVSHPVPGTSMTIATFARSGEVSVCAPGDEPIKVNARPNAWVSVGADKMECISFDRQAGSTVRYEPLRLPPNTVPLDVAGRPTNPYEAVTGVQYFVDQRARYWGADRLPIAVLPDGRSCDNGIAVPMAANPGRWLSKSTINCVMFMRTPGGVVTQITGPR